MPIYSLEGTPGSGKTLYCVQKIIPDFLKIKDSQGNLVPRHIFTNIEGLRPEILCSLAGIPYESIADYFHVLGRCVDENGHEYEDKNLVRYWYYQQETIEWVETVNSNKSRELVPNPEKAKLIPIGSLVIIDEIQNYYSNRDFATIYSKSCIDYITKNRHYGWTLWWMSQSVEAVDVTFRRNTQYVYFLERKEIYGSANSSSVKQYEGWLVGDKVNTPPFAVQTFKFDKRYFNAYQSYVQGVNGNKDVGMSVVGDAGAFFQFDEDVAVAGVNNLDIIAISVFEFVAHFLRHRQNNVFFVTAFAHSAGVFSAVSGIQHHRECFALCQQADATE